MADTTISALSQTFGSYSTNDLMLLVDVLDTTMASTGTNKALKVSGFLSNYLAAGNNITITPGAGGITIACTAVPDLSAGYIIKTADSNLTNAQVLASLSGAPGLLKVAATTGVLSVASAGTDYLTSVATANIAAGAVTYAKIQNATASTLLGNPTGGAAAPSEITLGTGLSFSGTTLIATAAGGMSNPMTTAGDVIYASVTGTPATPARLAIGSTGQMLTVVSGNPAWSSTNLAITQHLSPYHADTISAGTWTADCAAYDNHSATLSASSTLVLANAVAGCLNRFRIQQAASGGPYTLTLPGGVTWFTPSFSAPTMPTTANAVLIIALNCTGSGTYDGFVIGSSAA